MTYFRFGVQTSCNKLENWILYNLERHILLIKIQTNVRSYYTFTWGKPLSTAPSFRHSSRASNPNPNQDLFAKQENLAYDDAYTDLLWEKNTVYSLKSTDEAVQANL